MLPASNALAAKALPLNVSPFKAINSEPSGQLRLSVVMPVQREISDKERLYPYLSPSGSFAVRNKIDILRTKIPYFSDLVYQQWLFLFTFADI